MPTFIQGITTTGSSGSATGSWVLSPVKGLIDMITLDYHADAPATTDVTVVEGAVGSEATMAQTVLTRTDTKTDGSFYPRHSTHTSAGAAGSGEDMFYIEGKLTISVAGCDALTNAVVVTIRILEAETIR